MCDEDLWLAIQYFISADSEASFMLVNKKAGLVIAQLESKTWKFNGTGNSLLDALILVSTNPQYDKILFIDLPVQYMKTPPSEHVVYINCFECQNKNKKTIYVHNMFSGWILHVLNW